MSDGSNDESGGDKPHKVDSPESPTISRRPARSRGAGTRGPIGSLSFSLDTDHVVGPDRSGLFSPGSSGTFSSGSPRGFFSSEDGPAVLGLSSSTRPLPERVQPLEGGGGAGVLHSPRSLESFDIRSKDGSGIARLLGEFLENVKEGGFRGGKVTVDHIRKLVTAANDTIMHILEESLNPKSSISFSRTDEGIIVKIEEEEINLTEKLKLFDAKALAETIMKEKPDLFDAYMNFLGKNTSIYKPTFPKKGKEGKTPKEIDPATEALSNDEMNALWIQLKEKPEAKKMIDRTKETLKSKDSTKEEHNLTEEAEQITKALVLSGNIYTAGQGLRSDFFMLSNQMLRGRPIDLDEKGSFQNLASGKMPNGHEEYKDAKSMLAADQSRMKRKQEAAAASRESTESETIRQILASTIMSSCCFGAMPGDENTISLRGEGGQYSHQERLGSMPFGGGITSSSKNAEVAAQFGKGSVGAVIGSPSISWLSVYQDEEEHISAPAPYQFIKFKNDNPERKDDDPKYYFFMCRYDESPEEKITKAKAQAEENKLNVHVSQSLMNMGSSFATMRRIRNAADKARKNLKAKKQGPEEVASPTPQTTEDMHKEANLAQAEADLKKAGELRRRSPRNVTAGPFSDTAIPASPPHRAHGLQQDQAPPPPLSPGDILRVKADQETAATLKRRSPRIATQANPYMAPSNIYEDNSMGSLDMSSSDGSRSFSSSVGGESSDGRESPPKYRTDVDIRHEAQRVAGKYAKTAGKACQPAEQGQTRPIEMLFVDLGGLDKTKPKPADIFRDRNPEAERALARAHACAPERAPAHMPEKALGTNSALNHTLGKKGTLSPMNGRNPGTTTPQMNLNSMLATSAQPGPQLSTQDGTRTEVRRPRRVGPGSGGGIITAF